MLRKKNSSKNSFLIKSTVNAVLLVLPVGICTGSLVALFLWLLNGATQLRFSHPWLLFLLPASGVLIHFLYKIGGRSSEKGNNLVIEEIHQPGVGVPGQMLPLVFISTLITHLFGGSAGREGTAVQMGGSLAGVFARLFNLQEANTKLALIGGIAAGFGAVFGTPVAGGVFAIEVLAIGTIRYHSLLPAMVASIIGDFVCDSWGIKHQLYTISNFQAEIASWLYFDWLLTLKVALAAIFFGLAGYLFSISSHAMKRLFLHFFGISWLSPVVGGLLIILFAYWVGADYLGLGLSSPQPDEVTILSSFQAGGAHVLSWFWKMVFTVITLGSGFKGGEVTPLFYIGSTLGNSLAIFLDAPVGLFAALGFIAVFAAASNTPIACTILGVELFGGQYIIFYALACFIAYVFSGHSGIYSSQRIVTPKIFWSGFSGEVSLEQLSKRRRNAFRRYLVKYRLKKKSLKKH